MVLKKEKGGEIRNKKIVFAVVSALLLFNLAAYSSSKDDREKSIY